MTRPASPNNLTDKLPLVLALDKPWSESEVWLDRCRGQIWGIKIGSILFTEKGPQIIEKILAADYKVFLDLKYHDIPNTVQNAVRTAFSWGVNLLTVHGSGGRQMLEAAASEQKNDNRVLAITVLTSLDERNLKETGVERNLADQVQGIASLAMQAGVKGLVSSADELELLRKNYPSAYLVTPGVRFTPGGDDQKRTADIETVIQRGSSLAVIGRALTAAKDWEKEWQNIISSTEKTLLKKQSQ